VDDMLGMFEQSPRFVKKFASLREVISEAAASYASDVREGKFPTDAQCYGVVQPSTKKTSA